MKKDTGMACTQCGACCFVHFAAYVTDEDISRWRREGREDILRVLENDKPVWAGDRLVSAESGSTIQRCPFLRMRGPCFSCAVYETRPLTCRDYRPGSSELCPLYRRPGRTGESPTPQQ